jgi:hypothetical protein
MASSSVAELVRPAAHHLRDSLAARLRVRTDVVDDQMCQSLGMSLGVCHRDDAAHRGADQREALEPELVRDRGEISDLVAILVGAVRRPGALPVSAHVRGDHVEALAKVSRRGVERLGARGVPVHTHDRGCAVVAPVEVVQLEPADRQELALRLQQAHEGVPPAGSVARTPFWRENTRVT